MGFKEKPALKKYKTCFLEALNVLLSHWHEHPRKTNQPTVNKTIHNVSSLPRVILMSCMNDNNYNTLARH